MKIVLKNVSGESITIAVKPEDTFHDLKTRIQNESGIQLDLEQLNFKGKKITDDQIVAEYFFDGMYRFSYMDYNLFIAEITCTTDL
jgi:hypothetical protein